MRKENPIADIYPLSPLQQGMLFHSLYAARKEVYFEQLSFTIEGPLDEAAFRRAWEQLVERHGVLRTAFVWGKREEPLQVVFRRGKLDWREEDWRGVGEHAARLDELMRGERATGFDLSRLPLMRFALLRLADDTRQFVWSYHHLLLDGWSVSLLLKELFALYDANCLGHDAGLAPPRPYGDFISWLRRQDLAEAEAYWRRTLKGFAAPTPLALAAPASKVAEGEEAYRQQSLAVDASTAATLQTLARGSQLTVNTLMQGALALLLSRYSGERDVIFGATVAGRPAELPGVDSMVGLFINTIPVRARVDEEQPALSWLKALQSQQVESRSYEYSPLVEIQSWSEVPRGTPLFDSLLVFENYPTAHSSRRPAGGLRIRNVRAEDWSDYGLTLSAWLATELTLRLAYDGNRFDGHAIAQLLARFRRVLEAFANDPATRLADIDILSTDERRRLLDDWGRGRPAAFPHETGLAELFARQAHARPDAVAVSSEGLQLTYAELERRANRLARHLRALGVVRGARVGLCLERSPEMVTAMVAILKAGGGYVPLDASYPLERLSFMIEDAGLGVVVTDAARLERLPAFWGQAVCLDTEAELIAAYSSAPMVSACDGAEVAYISYTSGSTGVPKGVEVTHRGMARLVVGGGYARLDETRRVLHLSPLTFDASTFEVWGALLHGGSVVVLGAGLPTPERIGEAVREQGVTTAWLTSSLFNAVIDTDASVLTALEELLVGGEALSAKHVREALAALPGTRLINGYGPTEATTFACTWEVPRELGAGEVIRIGVPIGNTSAYVVDGAGRLAAEGVAGELMVGGAGLARGYLNRAALTAERFVPDGYSGEAGGRVYRTGDVVRWVSGGELEYVGRADGQVKVRGFRIELGEVEAVLGSHPAVKAVAAAVLGENGGGKRLVAYVVGNGGGSASESELKRWMQGRVPEYMVPGRVVALDALPLTPSGKVDRRQLPAPEVVRAEGEAEFDAPRTATEEALAEVWAVALDVARVGARDNYFELGGDSIRSIQVVAKARERGLVFSIEQLFSHPTVRELAEAIGGPTVAEAPETVAPFALVAPSDRALLPADVEDAYPLTRLQAGMVFHSELSPSSAIYHDIFSLHLRAPLDEELFRRALGDLVARHAVLRTSFELTAFGEPLQLVHREPVMLWHAHDLTHLERAEQERALDAAFEEERSQPFDWRRAPLWRVGLYRRDAETFQLMLSLHHAIIDGWSLATLLTEWFQHYWRLRGASEVDVPPPPRVAFRDFVRLEIESRASEETARFWREKLSGQRPSMLPRLGACEPHESAPRATERIEPLSDELAAGANRLAARLGVPLKSVLLAVHLWMLSWLAGDEDVTTGLVTHGRPEEEGGERVLGLFLNTLPLRLRLNGGTWAELALETFRLEQETFPHRRYPLADIQQLNDGRTLFETAFGFLHFHVYQAFDNFGDGVRVLDGRALTETNFTLISTFGLDPASSLMRLVLMYDTAQLSADWIEATSRHYLRTLQAMIADPEARHTSHSPFTESERQHLLVDWNRTTTGYPRTSTIDELFTQRAALAPDAIALSFDGQHTSYGELDRRANQLAHHLRARGLRPGSTAALLLPRSPELFVSMLATLKAGAAYLPLDPSHPSERLRFMVADADAPLLVADGADTAELATFAHAGLSVVDLSGEAAHIAARPTRAPRAHGTGHDLAYVNYTSGSTGTPKGIAVPHRAVNRLVINTDYVRLTSADRVAQGSNSSFDALTFELWGALLNGARLVGVAPEVVLAPERYARLLQEEGVTALFMTTALFNQMARQAPWGFAGVGSVLFGGQAADPSRVAEVLTERAVTGWPSRLLHVYGPTENTTFSTWHLVEQVSEEARTVPIGRPIANSTGYVLDARMRAAAQGAVGELYVGGEGLATSYVRRAELTAERFVPDPFSSEPGARLYKTGDLVRMNVAGEVEFVGRVDEQVKVRGFRVEPGEVAAVLSGAPGVSECVVVARRDASGEQQLVAYVVREGEDAAGVGALRVWARERLPEYMVPGRVVELGELPLNANGKVDRKALPALDEGVSVEDVEHVEPRTPEEELLAGIFAQVLKAGRVGAHASFFDLGGHSLMATQVMSRVREVFEVDVPLRQLFETPTVADLAEQIGKARLAGMGRLAPPIVRAAAGESAPLSFAQQRLWFLDQFEPESPFYNIPAALRLEGPLRLDALAQSLCEIARRHEVLRASFPRAEGRPAQTVSEPRFVPVDFADFSGCSTAEAEALVERVAREEVLRPFDLSAGPLLRVRLLRLGARTHVLLLTQHHIVSDGWSIGILFRELVALYRAYGGGAPSPLAELAVQYGDFARWQRDWLQGEELERQLSYWRGQLAGAPTVVQLPTDRPRPSVETFRGEVEPVALSPELSDGLKSLCERQGVTTFMALLAAFGALLHRYTGQDDLLVGAPIANRHRAETEELIGFFVNTLALRTQFDGGEISFSELLAQVRHTCLGAYAHQDLPFEKLVGELLLERETSRNPLVQVVLAFQNVPLAGLEFDGLALAPMPVTNGTSLFDLTLSLTETAGGLVGYFQYSTSLFDAATIKRMKRHFETLLAGLVAEPLGRVADAPLLTEEERRQLAAEWGGGAQAPALPCPHELFEARAAERPDAVALVSEEGTLSYGELNARANQVAHLLRGLGVGPESVVGLCVERTNELVIGLLGILKAGGAYLPLDPHHLAARADYMLEAAGARVLLIGAGVEREWPSSARVLRLDAEPALDAQPRTRVPGGARVREGNLAYVIYTSGSTGTPKGVMVTHRNVARLMWVTQGDFGFDEQDTWTLFHSPAFDFSVWELWGALSYGGTLVVVPYWVTRSPQLFCELLAQECVTVLNQTPSAFRQLIQAEETRPDGAPPLSLRSVIFGGEALEPTALRPWFARHGDDRPRLVNMYGITETTVHVTYRALSEGDAREGAGSVIGGPLGDLRLYVLGAGNRPVPAKVTGQLCVGGDGVARGYLDRPELTAERFTPDPFASRPGARLYQSGDLARQLPGGDIEYQGRMDHQVKVRGFRIELGEIEAALLAHTAVREALVLARREGAGDSRLVAYVVPTEPGAAAVSELRGHAQARLPEYMVPAAFVLLERLPLTPNGKVDRKALPAPGAEGAEAEGDYEPPQTPVERLLADIWSKVLGVARVGRHDNFFELGGDSIMSIQVTAKAAREGYALTPKQLFLNPTVAQLACIVAEAAPRAADDDDTAAGPFALTPIQRWFFEQDLADPHHWNQSVILQFRAPLAAPTVLAAARAVMSYHDALRLRFVRDADGWRQSAGEADGEDAAVSFDLRAVADADLPRAIESAAEGLQASLDLGAGPLWRAAVFDCGPERSGRLLLVAHHLVIDGVSWRILLEDLQTAAAQLGAGRPVALSPRTTSYRRWSRALAEYASSDELRGEVDHWLGVADAEPAVLPRDDEAGENTVASTEVVSRALDAEQTRALLTQVPAAARAQINEVLLTALAQALGPRADSSASAATPLLIDLEGHGREELSEGIDLTRTVGWFTTIFPVLLELEPGRAPADALAAVKAQLRRVPHNGFGYGVLRYLSEDEGVAARLRAARPAQMSFNYLGQFDQVLDEAAPLRLSNESGGRPHSPRGRRLYELEVTASVQGGLLRLAVIYSRNQHRRATIESLADELVARLGALVADLREPAAASLTTSDFPRAQVSQEDLNKLVARLGKRQLGGMQ